MTLGRWENSLKLKLLSEPHGVIRNTTYSVKSAARNTLSYQLKAVFEEGGKKNLQ